MDHDLSEVDQEIYSCLNLNSPQSFFLFAGAGTGKTRSLVTVLKTFQDEKAQQLRYTGQKVGIITFTNAASDEIKRRLGFDSTFFVSTIHSFSWELIKSYQNDIKEWVRINTKKEIEELEEKERRGRPGSKASRDRKRKISSKSQRLSNIDNIISFNYSPTGINSGYGALNHAEVIKMTSDFLINKPLLQKIMIKRFPILLIDESQDTKESLIDAFFEVENKYNSEFSLGLFGDTMQRIYMDGKPNLGEGLPDRWAKPQKEINYRCPKRVIKLTNKIRGDQPQKAPEKVEEGTIRLFIIDSDKDINKSDIESRVRSKMGEESKDKLWESSNNVKVLTLEHHMAASRSGFINFFAPLYNMSSDSTPLLDGTMRGIPFLTNQLIPLVNFLRNEDDFSATRLMKRFSPLLEPDRLEQSESAIKQIEKAKEAINEFYSLWEESSDPKLIDILLTIYELNLLAIPEVLKPIVQRTSEDLEVEEEGKLRDSVIEAWDSALESSLSEAVKYAEYISDESNFDTHQGIKGLEFPRVLVILDDEESRGFLFNYEKLLGAKEPSTTDKRNEKNGKETTIDRTKRLFYVTCSRAEESLAVVAYTQNVEKVKNHAISQDWFSENEIIILDS